MELIRCSVCGCTLSSKEQGQTGTIVCDECMQRATDGRDSRILPRVSAPAARPPAAAPAKGATRIATKRVAATVASPKAPSAAHWICVACGAQLNKTLVMAGEAEIIQGRLYCRPCIKRQDAKVAKPPVIPIIAGFVALAAYVAGAIVFPAHVIFLSIIAASLAALAGLLAFGMRGSVRVMMVAGGVAVAAGLAWLLTAVQERDQSKQELSAMMQQAGEVRAMLKADKFADARTRFEVLRELEGKSREPQAGRLVKEIDTELETWVKSNYGISQPIEAEVLTALLTIFPEKTAAGERRFRQIKVENETLLVQALTQHGGLGAAPAVQRNMLTEANGLLAFVGERFPQFSTYELHLVHSAEKSGSEVVFKLTAEQIKQLQESADPAALLKTFQAQ